MGNKKRNFGRIIVVFGILLLTSTISSRDFIPDNIGSQSYDDDIIDDDYVSDTVTVINNISYKTYKNERFLFSIDFPSDFVVGEMPQNGDGRRFSGKSAELVVSGNWVLEDIHGNIENYYKMTKEWKHSVTYERLTNNWFVLSGFDEDGKIYYSKTIYKKYDDNEDMIAITATLTYDASENAYYGKIINHIFTTLN